MDIWILCPCRGRYQEWHWHISKFHTKWKGNSFKIYSYCQWFTGINRKKGWFGREGTVEKIRWAKCWKRESLNLWEKNQRITKDSFLKSSFPHFLTWQV